MSREAMKLALEALEVATTPFARDRQEVLRAQAALREALAEQPAQQEPVACRYGDNGYACCEGGPCAAEEHNDKTDWQERGMVAEAALAKLLDEKDEPVAGCVCRWNSEGDRVVTCERHQGWLEVIAEWADRAREAEKKLKALITSPPAQRTWVELTDAERIMCRSYDPEEAVAKTEAKLKEKNA